MRNAHRYTAAASLIALSACSSLPQPALRADAGSRCALRSPIAAARWMPNRKRAIEGTVHRINTLTDTSNTALSGAAITISGPADRTTVVDSAGRFSVVDLPEGTYAVTVSHAGFPTRRDSLVVDSTGAVGDIRLRDGMRYPICTRSRALAP
jgi:hypothetical protein